MFNTIVTPNSTTNPWSFCSDSAIGDSAFTVANSNHPGGVNVLLADGSVRFVKNSINQQPWFALGTRAGGEIMAHVGQVVADLTPRSAHRNSGVARLTL
jgi:prepilin-type processing-associated H-X9-DG protein